MEYIKQIRMQRYMKTAEYRLELYNWLRGYANSFDDSENANAIVHKLRLAAALLDDVWDEYAKKEGL